MIPNIYIHRDFQKAEAKLPEEIKNKVSAFFPKFRRNPKSHAIDFEKIISFKDKNLRTVRIDGNYRAIVGFPPTGNNYYFLWVDNHAGAHAWAKNKKLSWNSITHSMQLYEPIELKVSSAEVITSDSVPFYHPYNLTEDDLLNLGVPLSEVEKVIRIISLDKLQEVKNNLPDEAFEKISHIFNGFDKRELLEQVREGKSISEDTEEQLLSANNRYNCIKHTTDDPLMIDFLEGKNKWQLFLHPEQTKLVEGRYNGPVKITGGAGTGKTVAALHRFAYLVKKGLPEGKRLLFCTYTNALAGNLNAQIKELNLSNRGCYDVMTIHSLAFQLASKISHLKNQLDDRSKKDDDYSQENKKKIWLGMWQKILTNTAMTPEFAAQEYEQVILFNQIESKEDYLLVQRKGRGTKISASDKEIFWEKHLEYREAKRKSFKLEWDELFYELIRHFRKQDVKPYAHIILDELQDLSNIEIRFLRTILNPGENDLFMVGDPLQKVYDRNINFLALKIETRGKKSRRLLRNYRTTEEIRKDAVKALGDETFSDFGDSIEKIQGYTSLSNGPEPVYHFFKTNESEIQFVESTIKELTAHNQYVPEDICIAAKTKDIIQSFHSHFHTAGYNIRKIEKNNELSLPSYLSTSTFHNLKGLEFKVIFLVGLHAQSFLRPLMNASEEERKEAEKREKALLYVAMTRAKELLFISGHGKPSPFLQKIYPFLISV
jgi:superfamily I DNA/RNA helicase/mRNA-degrading endonuclease RelE of RelBE toxin-antitoxin system